MEQLPMTRADNWRVQLTEYLAGAAREPFVMGKHDCWLFAASAVKAMTGKDIARGFRGYKTLAAGIKMGRKKGFRDHVAVVASKFDEVPVAMARLGDIAVVPAEDGPALGIVQGEMIYIAGKNGLGLVPLLSAERAFRV